MIHVPRQALPITLQILSEFVPLLDSQDPFDATFWAALLTAFFCLLRKSNLVPDTAAKFDPQHQLCRGDFKVHPECMLVCVRWSKTIQFSQKVLEIPLVAFNNSPLCPVNAYTNMVKLVPGKSNEPAFMVHLRGVHAALTYHQFQNKLKSLIAATGRNPALYSSHSIRRGGATLAFQAQVPGELIKVQGDWSSDSYLRYLHVPLEQRVLVAGRVRQYVLSQYAM